MKLMYESTIEVRIMEILVENISWIFSGIGVYILGILLNREKTKDKKKTNQNFKFIIDNDKQTLEFSLKNKNLNQENGD